MEIVTTSCAFRVTLRVRRERHRESRRHAPVSLHALTSRGCSRLCNHAATLPLFRAAVAAYGQKTACCRRLCVQPCNPLGLSTVASMEAWAQRVATMWSTPVLRMCCCASYPPRTARYTFPGQEVGQAARRACVQRLFEAGRIPKAVCV
jgi:hypothetical protein